MNPASSSRRVRFGAFEADLRSGELFKHGLRIKVQDQPFQILAALLEHPGELVTREELQRKLWAGNTFVDFDAGLNAGIRRLRDALCESNGEPKFIETVPRRGYRFIAAVETLSEVRAPTSTTVPIVTGNSNGEMTAASVHEDDGTGQKILARPAESAARWRKAWLLLALAAIVPLSLLIAFELRKAPSPPSRRTFVLPPAGTTFNLIGDAGGAVALSPDGTKLAFVAVDAKGKALIWLRALGKLAADPLDGTDGATFPFWSPDGRWIAFFADSKLKKVPSDGGQPIILCDATFGRGGSWNSRGEIIFAPTSHSAIYRVPDSGGTLIPVTTVDTSIHTTHRWPKFLPDGQHFIYLAASHFRDASHNAVYLTSLHGTENKLLVPTDADATYVSGYLFFLRDGTLLAQSFDPQRGEMKSEPHATVEKVLYDPGIWKAVFDTSESGVIAYQLGERLNGTQLRWFDRSGRQLGDLGEPTFQFIPKLSRDGRKLAIGIADGGYSHLWVYEIARGGRMQITFTKYDNGSPVWSADGARILFSGKRQHYGIYQIDSSGTEPERLILDVGSDAWPLDLSTDGRYLLFAVGDAIGGHPSQLWVFRFGDQAPFRLLKGNALESNGQFSPDGRWVAYTSNQSGRDEVYVMPFHGERPRNSETPMGSERSQISLSGGGQPRWRRDGKLLFYVDADNTIVAVPVTMRAGKLVIGIPRSLFSAANSQPGTHEQYYDVSPDGSKFIINTAAQERAAPITLVENWLSDVRK